MLSSAYARDAPKRQSLFRAVATCRTATGECRMTAELFTAGYQSEELDAFLSPGPYRNRMVRRLSRNVSFDLVRKAGTALTRFLRLREGYDIQSH